MKTMKMLTILVLALGLMVWLAEVSQAAPMGTAWTYQGRLIDANSAAEGEYDFQFKVYDDPDRGSQQGSSVIREDVDVTDGYFTVELDFGRGVFDGNRRWLEVGVRPGGSSDVYTTLSPRQEITPAPYALYAADSPDPDIGVWTVKRWIDNDQVFRGIVEQIAAGGSVNGSLVYLNTNNREVRRINFFDIVPVSFEMLTRVEQSTSGLEETLTFMVSRVELGLSLTQPPSLRLFTNDFIFYLNGEAVDGVITVDPGLILFDIPEPQPIDSIPLTPDLLQEPFFSYAFTFDLVDGQAPADRRWETINGGEIQFIKLDREGLEITFSEVKLSGPMLNRNERREMVDWLNEWLRGTGTATNSTMEILFADQALLTMYYRNVVPVSYWPSPVNFTYEHEVYESVVLRAGIIEAR